MTDSLSSDRVLVTSIFTSVVMPVETDAVVVRCRRLLDEDSASGLTVRIAQILMRRAAGRGSVRTINAAENA